MVMQQQYTLDSMLHTYQINLILCADETNNNCECDKVIKEEDKIKTEIVEEIIVTDNALETGQYFSTLLVYQFIATRQ